MDPIRSPLPNLSAVMQALLLRQGLQPAEVEALLQLVGQELSVLFLKQSPEGARLELPSGKIVTAQGELPFPEGTHLKVRVEAEAGGLKLQTLEARPPAQPTLLAPLLQGEAAELSARLAQAPVTSELAPLVQLLRVLGGVSESAPPQVLPSLPLLSKEIAALPRDLQVSLAKVLGAPDATPEALAAKLSARLEAAVQGKEPVAIFPKEGNVDLRAQFGVAEGVLVRFQGLLQQTELPLEHTSALDGWIRGLLARRAPEKVVPARTQAEAPRAAKAAPAADSRLLTRAETARVEDAVKAHGGPALEVSEAWEGWIKGNVRALSDPGVSPREAPFHALQAREGTAFFEIPLPWAGAKPLQLWIEEEGHEDRAPATEESRRVLLALELSNLGELRVGLQSTRQALSVRIWTEHPAALEFVQAEVEAELRDSGKAIDLRILSLSPSAEGRNPDVRALAMGSTLHALG